MNTTNIDELIVQAETLKNLLVARATHKHDENANEEYNRLRLQLIAASEIKTKLPRFVRSCRTLEEFWDFIKSKYDTYAERRKFLQESFDDTLSFLESELSSSADSVFDPNNFLHQFPAGLPFGIEKPSLIVRAENKRQRLYFNPGSKISIIRNGVYPNLTFQKFKSLIKAGNIEGVTIPPIVALILKIQTESERKFFNSYSSKYDMQNKDVPVLIPQAWIQWHSKTKKDLRSQASSYADELYRVDFVVFWNNKRYSILVDDISHYAHKEGSQWIADQNNYSMRLKEDRKLRKEGWIVFRISNWEMRNDDAIQEILTDFREYIGF